MSEIMEEEKQPKAEVVLEVQYLPMLPEAQSIEFNHEELKTQLATVLNDYKGLVYTEKTVADAKKTVADLRKKKTLFDDERKRVKNIYMQPVNEYDKKFMEVIALFQEPINEIAKQIENFDLQQKAKKEEEIKAFYEEQFGDLVTQVPFTKVFQKEWTNASSSKKAYTDAITKMANDINANLQLIVDMKSDFEDELRITYLETLDLSATMQKSQRLVQAKIDREKREEDARALQAKKDEEARIEAEEKEKALANYKEEEFEAVCDEFDVNEIDFNPQPQPQFEAVMVQPESDEQTDEEIKNMFDSLRTEPRPIDFAQTPAVSQTPTLQTMTFWALGSPGTLEALKSFMVDNDIEFEIVEG